MVGNNFEFSNISEIIIYTAIIGIDNATIVLCKIFAYTFGVDNFYNLFVLCILSNIMCDPNNTDSFPDLN